MEVSVQGLGLGFRGDAWSPGLAAYAGLEGESLQVVSSLGSMG